LTENKIKNTLNKTHDHLFLSENPTPKFSSKNNFNRSFKRTQNIDVKEEEKTSLVYNKEKDYYFIQREQKSRSALGNYNSHSTKNSTTPPVFRREKVK
jgi:hypothetical protein